MDGLPLPLPQADAFAQKFTAWKIFPSVCSLLGMDINKVEGMYKQALSKMNLGWSMGLRLPTNSAGLFTFYFLRLLLFFFLDYFSHNVGRMLQWILLWLLSLRLVQHRLQLLYSVGCCADVHSCQAAFIYIEPSGFCAERATIATLPAHHWLTYLA